MIWLENPDLAIMKIVDEFLILLGPHIAGPHDLRRVDIRVIVNIFIIHSVTWTITYQD